MTTYRECRDPEGDLEQVGVDESRMSEAFRQAEATKSRYDALCDEQLRTRQATYVDLTDPVIVEAQHEMVRARSYANELAARWRPPARRGPGYPVDQHPGSG